MSRRLLNLLAALSLLVSTAGCSVSRGTAFVVQRLRLDRDRPASTKWDLRLLRVDPDGTVVYRDGEQTRSVAPLEKGARMPLVVESDFEGQSALFIKFGCRSHTVYRLGPFVHSVLGQ